MATKQCFIVNEFNNWEEKIIEFTYVKGLAFSQKQKNVLSFHSSIETSIKDAKILEVSTKSNNPLGVKLSAFNLKLNGISFECVFQSGKVFENNVSFPEVLKMTPGDAKRYVYERSKDLSLIGFKYNNVDFPLLPKSMFYDYIYIKAVLSTNTDIDELAKFNVFTDIEFNEKKQINCQARAIAILVSLYKRNILKEAMTSVEKFRELVYEKGNTNVGIQLKLF